MTATFSDRAGLSFELRLFPLLELIIGHESFQPFDGDGFVHISTAAVLLTGPDADPAQDPGKAGCLPDGLEGVKESSLLDQFDIASRWEDEKDRRSRRARSPSPCIPDGGPSSSTG